MSGPGGAERGGPTGARPVAGGVRWLRAGALAAVLLLAAAPRPAAAQVTAADTAAVLLDVAQQLRAERRDELARELLRRIAARYAGTAAADEAARLLAAAGGDQRGRTELMVWSTLYGLWLGVAVPATFGADSETAYGLGLLAGGPAGLLAARRYAASRPLTEGQARAITFGGTWGTWQGFGWREVFEIGNETRQFCFDAGDPSSCFDETETSSEAVFAAMVLGGLGGIGAGLLLAGDREISAGTATAVNFGALWGTWYGVALGVLLDLEDDDLLAATLLGGNGGLLATALLAPGWNLTRERARLISIAGVAGALGGAGLDLLIQPESEKVAILIPAVTSVIGLTLGATLTADRYGPARGGEPGSGSRRDAARRGIDWGAPMIEPALLPGDRTGATRVPGLRLTLVRAAF